MEKAVDPFVKLKGLMANMDKAAAVYSALDGLLGERLMTRFKRAISSAFLASVLVQAVAAHAATYYVATTGNDANTCAQAKTQSTPRLTIPAGVACLAGGDTLIIKSGTYTNQEIKNPPAGSAGNYTVIKGDPSGPRPIIDPDSAAFQRGLYCDNGEACRYIELRYVEITTAYNSVKLAGNATVGYAHHVRFIDNIMHDSLHASVLIITSHTGYQGGDHYFSGNEFYRTGSSNPGYAPGHNTIYNPGNRTIVEKNTFHNLANAVGIWQKDTYIQNVIVRSNVFYDIGRHLTDTWQVPGGGAVHVSVPGGGHQMYNNIVYRSGESSLFSAFRINPQFSGQDLGSVKINNNTVYNLLHPDASAILVTFRGLTVGGPHYIQNNIAYLAGNGIPYVGSHVATNNLTTNPSFANPAGSDFRLLRGSDAIDKGMAVAGVPIDFAGVPRPQGAGYDIGAYEAGDGNGPLAPKGLSAH